MKFNDMKLEALSLTEENENVKNLQKLSERSRMKLKTIQIPFVLEANIIHSAMRVTILI